MKASELCHGVDNRMTPARRQLSA